MRPPSFVRGIVARLTQSYWPARASRIVYVQSTLAGVRISPDTALQNGAVWACVNILARAVAQLPWRAMKRTAAHSAEISDTSRLDYILNERPNPEMSAFTFRQTMVGHLLLWGNAYAEIERDGAGRIAALWPIEPDRVSAKRRPTTNRLYYQVTNQNQPIAELDFMDMYHVKGLSFDGVTGYQTTGYAAQSIGLAMAMERFGAAFFGNNAMPGGVIRNKKAALSEDAKEALIADFNGRAQGPDMAFKWHYLDNDMEVTPTTIVPEQGQFVESRQAQVDEVCRWFGVPPHMVASLTRSTNNNIESQGIDFVVHGVAPLACLFEQEANFKCIGDRNPGRLFTRIDVRSLQRGDTKARTDFYTAMFNAGAMSPNMILEAEGLNPVGAAGDKHFVGVALTTLESAGEPAPQVTPADDGTSDPDGGDSADPATTEGDPNADPAADAASEEAVLTE